MTISELITELEKFKEQHGDAIVFLQQHTERLCKAAIDIEPMVAIKPASVQIRYKKCPHA
jgi:hypothetical protein